MPDVVFVDAPVPIDSEVPKNVDNVIYYQARSEEEDVFQDPVEPEEVKKESTPLEEIDVFLTAESDPVSVANLGTNVVEAPPAENMNDVMERLDQDLHVITQMSNEIDRAINASNGAYHSPSNDDAERIELLEIHQDNLADHEENDLPDELATREVLEVADIPVMEEISMERVEEEAESKAEMEMELELEAKSENEMEFELEAEAEADFLEEVQEVQDNDVEIGEQGAKRDQSPEQEERKIQEDGDKIYEAIEFRTEDHHETEYLEKPTADNKPDIIEVIISLNNDNDITIIIIQLNKIAEVIAPEAEQAPHEMPIEIVVPTEEIVGDIPFVNSDESVMIPDAAIAHEDPPPDVPMAVEEEDDDFNDIEYADEEDEEIIAAESQDRDSVEERPFSAEAFEQHVRKVIQDDFPNDDRIRPAVQIISSRLNQVMSKEMETKNLSPDLPTAPYDVMEHVNTV